MPSILELKQRAAKSINRLHHVGIRYLGAMVEVVTGQKIMFVPADRPGVHELRDFISLGLILRAEVNAITKILIDNKMVTHAQLLEGVTAEYNQVCKEKCHQFGFEVDDLGIILKPNDPNRN